VKYYVIRNGQPVHADLLQWVDWLQAHGAVVVQHEITSDLLVSTIFLGFDIFDREPPLLWETVRLQGGHVECVSRFSDLEVALDFHHALVREATRALVVDVRSRN